MDHITCSSCGYNALPVATRCPRCGHAFGPELLQQRPAFHSRSRGVVLALLILAGAGAVFLGNLRHDFGRPLGPPRQGALSPPATVADSARPRPAPSLALPPTVAAPAPPSQRARPAPPAEATPAAAPPAAVESTAAGPRELRYANTWVNVRAGRRRTASVVRTLSPGDSVRVDSLSQGWYRAVVAGQTLGYVDRSFLDSTPRRE